MHINHKQGALLLAAALLTTTLTGCGSQETETQAPAAGVAVQVETVAQQTISTDNTVSGQVTADNETTIFLGSSAKCTAVYFQAGDTVSTGDIICTLDLGSTIANYNAANISYQAAAQSYQDQSEVLRRQVALQQKNVDDLKALFEIGAASQMEIDSAELQLQSAIAARNSSLAQLEAGMQTARASLEQLSTALENVDAAGNIIAPMPGTLVTMNAAVGEFTSTAAPVAVIDGVDQMKVTVSVAESLVPKLAAGDSVDVTVNAAEQSFTGTIRAVERAANLQTKLYTVTITVPSNVGGLLTGMFADVTFHTDTSEGAIVVPTEAILTSGDTQYVYVVEDGAAKYVAVTTGLTGTGITEITSGLAAGDQLVVVGQSYLTDGALVRVVDGEA